MVLLIEFVDIILPMRKSVDIHTSIDIFKILKDFRIFFFVIYHRIDLDL